MEYKEFLLAVTPHVDGWVAETRNPYPYVWTRGGCKVGFECAYNHLATYFDHISTGSTQLNTAGGVVGLRCKFGEMDCVVGIFFKTPCVRMVVFMGDDLTDVPYQSKRVLYEFEMSPTGRLLKTEGHFDNLVK
jgi:hypothetical protein